ncbi:E3 ubiquitin-protein ligase RHF2A [Linum perenne]
MEVPEMEEGKKAAAKLTSAAAFVEGGIQEECEDACSICLEEFNSSDPSTLTKCRHEYHLQCILEWCQRSSDCPMCLQPVILKDPSSQELFEAVEQERKIRTAAARNPTVLRHPTLGDFGLHHVGASDARLEARILQHLAAAAAMGRTHFGRRESHRSSSSSRSRPHLLVFSTNPNNAQQVSTSSPVSRRETTPLTSSGDVSPHHSSRSTSASADQSPDTAGSSSESFSESLKSRLSSLSMRYRDSFSRSTRGWTDRIFSRSNSLSDIGSEVQREVNASVSRMMERLDTRNGAGSDGVSQSPSPAHSNGGTTGNHYRDSI